MFRSLQLFLVLFLITPLLEAQVGRYQDSEIPTVENSAATRKLSGREAFELLISDSDAGAARRTQVIAKQDAKSATQIGWHHFDLNSWTTSEKWFNQALAWEPNSASAAEGLILSKFKAGNEREAYDLSRQYEALVPKARPLVVGAIEGKAWKFIEANQLDAAEAELSNLPQDEPKVAAAYAEIGRRKTQTAVKTESYAVARETAAAYGTDRKVIDDHLSGDLVKKAAQAQQDGRYQESSRLLDMAEKTRALDSDAQKIRAWNLYHTRNYNDSAVLFEKLYRAEPTKDAAEGLTYSLQQRGRVSDLNDLSKQLGGPLTVVAAPVLDAATQRERQRQQQQTEAARSNTQVPSPSAYAAQSAAPSPASPASQSGPSRYGAPPAPYQAPQNFNYGPPIPADRSSIGRVAKDPRAPENRRLVPSTSRVGMGIGFTQQSGDEGLAALRTTELPGIEGTAVFGPSQDQSLTLSIARKDFEVGEFTGNRPVGTAPEDATGRPSIATNATTFEPRVAYRNENSMGRGPAFSVEAGTTPIGGEIDPALTGSLGIDQKNESNEWRLGLFSESVQESILSATGLTDPYTGNQWGRVKRTGIRGEGFTSLNGGPWGAYGRFEFAGIGGENVEDNSAMGLTVGLSRNLSVPGFEYLSVGPSLNYESYEKNLSHFTYGHGGYFSPESMVQGLIGASFLTETGGPWLAGGYVGLGYQTNDQAASPYLPLSPDGREFDAVSESSVVFTANLQSVWELSSHWHFGASGGYSKTAAYEEYGGALFFRYLWEAQQGLGAADLLKSQ